MKKEKAIGWVIRKLYKQNKKVYDCEINNVLYNSFQTACEAIYYLTLPFWKDKYKIYKVTLSNVKSNYCVLKHKSTGELKLDRIYYYAENSKFYVNEALEHYKEYEIQFITINK